VSRIFITGDRGFFGTRFHSVFDHVHTVMGVDVAEVDIVDKAAVRDAVGEFRPDIVVHAAAITSTEFSNAQPDLTRKINVDGAANVAEAAERVGARLIFFSTEQVFNGNTDPGPYTEADKPVPNTMYGKTKLDAEQQLRDITGDLWVLRFTWLFGMPERNMPVNPNILWNTLQLALSGKRSAVARREFRGHTYGYDMIGQILGVLDRPAGTYHIGSRTDLDRYDITCHILKEVGLGERIDALVEPDNEKYSSGPRDVRLDVSKLDSLGISFDESPEALSRAIAEFGLRGALG